MRSRSSPTAVVAWCCAAAVFTACDGGGPAPRRVVVAAAANLRDAFPELEAAFEAAHPGVDLVATFGASGSFVAQIAADAPFDVFLSADVAFTRRVVDDGRADAADLFGYALGRVVLYAPAAERLDLAGRGVAALRDAAVAKIALANPATAPYGRVAADALQALGFDAELKPKLVFGENVAQAAHFVDTGAAQAAFLPLGTAAALAAKGRGGFVRLPDAAAPPIRQDGAVLKRSTEPAAARAFRAFLTGPEGRAILGRHGYEGVDG
jgi:molybdate transport system substrate-binding protein